jgi:hypothetical protein
MVAMADPFRAHWEAEDEYRKIGEREEFAEWLLWFLGTNSSARAEQGAFLGPSGVRAMNWNTTSHT